MGIKVISEKGLDQNLEVIGLEAKWLEVTIFEVMGKWFIDVMGKRVFEECLEVVDITKTIAKTKGKVVGVEK